MAVVDHETPFRLSPFRIVLMATVAGLCGLAVIPFLSIQLNPPPRSQAMQISYHFPGATPEIIESEITAPLEGILASVEGIENIESRSSEGRGQISIRFGDQHDISKKRLEVSARIRQMYEQFPAGTSFPEIRYQSDFESEQPLLTYAVNSDMPASELHDFLSRHLLPDIAALKGIASVNIRGAPRKEIHLRMDPKKLQALEVSPSQVDQAVRQSIEQRRMGKTNRPSSGSDPTPRYVYVQYSGEGSDTDPVRYIPRIPVTQREDRIIYVRDIGQISENTEPPNQYFRINGLQSIHLTITADRSANLIQLTEQSREIIDRFEEEYHSFIQVFESYNASEFLKRELRTIIQRSVATMVILLLFIIVIYRRWQQVFIIFFSLLLTLSASFLCYYLTGLSLHLYSIAGLTLSLGIILDNILIMSDHIRKKGNKDIFLAVFAATVTTIGAMAAIFLMEKSQRENLVDFFLIFSINLAMSLLTALFLIPALSEMFPLRRSRRFKFRIPRRVLIFNRIYSGYHRWAVRWRWVVLTLFILLFGIPFFLLPDKIEKENIWAEKYNKFQKNETYSDQIRPFMDRWLGGTFRLFYNHRDQFFFGSQQREETKLYLNAQMPAGGTLRQMNEVMLDLEAFLKTLPEIRQFHLNITSPQNARMEIYFKEEFEKSGFPYWLKDELTTFAVSSGSADFRIWGVGDAFDNVLPGESVSTHIILTGYNYDQIWSLARASQKMMEEHPRIRKVFINSDINYYVPDHHYFYLDFKDPAFLLTNDIHPSMMVSHFETAQRDFGAMTQWNHQGERIPIRIMQHLDREDQMWSFLHHPIRRDSASFFKQEDVFSLEKERGSQDIVRKNQAYHLVLEYSFIGNYRLGEKVLEDNIEQISAFLPVGYQVESQRYYWGRDQEKSPILWIILAGMLFIWILGGILFNSMRQALLPVLIIPFSYIGIFLMTHFFHFRFGQGGLASFLLVGGLSVNAVFFIINDYNRIRILQPHLPIPAAYLKAYNGKIVPILLTALSTVLGLLPFVLFGSKDPFWYSLALCTIGGMIASVIVLVLLLPVFYRSPKA